MVEEYKSDLENQENKTPTPVESNDFPKITEFVSQEGLEEKKDIINKILSDKKIKEGFENFLKIVNPRIKLKIKKDLQNCKTEEEIKSIIVENLPGYKIRESAENNQGSIDNLKNKDNHGNNISEENGDLGAELDNKEGKKVKAEEKEVIDLSDKKEEKNAEKIMEEVKEYRSKILAKNHPNLDAKTGPGTPLYERTKKQLENQGVISKLRQDNRDEDFINNYILVKATLQEVNNNSEYSQDEISTFNKIVKNLENSCNIPDTRLSNFSNENIGQTRKELFHEEIGNDSLIEAKKTNMKSESHEKAYAEMFPQMGDDDMFAKYGKFLEGDLKSFWLQYQTNSDFRDKVNNAQKNPTDENKQLVETYNKMYAETLKIKDDYETKTRDMVEELCLISQIKGMYMCMGEGDNFDLNKSREIRFDGKGAMILDGHIDGIDFSIRQEINNPEARLQTSQKLAKDKETVDDTDKGGNFVIGGKNNFVNSNFKLPTQDEIFSSITDTIKSDSSLENSNNQEEYLEDLQDNIMGNIDKKYENTKFVHHYMKEQVKGEKIVDKTIGFIENIKGSQVESTISNSNQKLYDFLNLMNYNIKYSTGLEKDRMNIVMDKINNMATLAETNPTSGELANHNNKFGKYVTGDSFINTRKLLRNEQAEGESAFDLFKNYKLESDGRNNGELYMINFEQMYNDLRIVENNKEESTKKEEDNKDLSEMEAYFDEKKTEYP